MERSPSDKCGATMEHTLQSFPNWGMKLLGIYPPAPGNHWLRAVLRVINSLTLPASCMCSYRQEQNKDLKKQKPDVIWNSWLQPCLKLTHPLHFPVTSANKFLLLQLVWVELLTAANEVILTNTLRYSTSASSSSIHFSFLLLYLKNSCLFSGFCSHLTFSSRSSLNWSPLPHNITSVLCAECSHSPGISLPWHWSCIIVITCSIYSPIPSPLLGWNVRSLRTETNSAYCYIPMCCPIRDKT